MAEPTASPDPAPDTDPAVTPSGPSAPSAPRRRDPVALVAGVVALVIAGFGLAGPGVLAAVDPRWVLAAAALAVGLTVLLLTLRPRRPGA